MLVSSVSGLVQFLPQQNLVVFSTHCQVFYAQPPHMKIQKSQAKTNQMMPEQYCQKQVTYTLVVKVWHTLASFLFPFSLLNYSVGHTLGDLYICPYCTRELWFTSFFLQGPHRDLIFFHFTSLFFSSLHQTFLDLISAFLSPCLALGSHIRYPFLVSRNVFSGSWSSVWHSDLKLSVRSLNFSVILSVSEQLTQLMCLALCFVGINHATMNMELLE